MWQIRATLFKDTSYLLWSFLFRVLSHLVLAVLAFIWGCSRAEPKMAAAAACAGRVPAGLRSDAGEAWRSLLQGGTPRACRQESWTLLTEEMAHCRCCCGEEMPLCIGICRLSRGTTHSLQE